MTDTKTVLITGTSTGIGLATAERFAQEGYIVYATARRPEIATTLKALAKKYPKNIIIKQLDVTDTEENIAHIIKQIGKIDILINNAGIGLTGPAHATTDEERRWVFNTNVFGLLNVTYAVLDEMIKHNSGKIISLSSIVGPLPDRYQATYSASKAALEHFMAVLRKDLEKAKSNIIVANIHPGPVITDFKASARSGTRFSSEKNPYPQVDSDRAEWEGIMENGKSVTETVDTIFRVVHQEKPDYWNPTEPAVSEQFNRVYKDITGNNFIAGLAVVKKQKSVI